MQEWAKAVSRRAWSRQIMQSNDKNIMEQFSVGENTDNYDSDDEVCWFIGLRGGVYSLKRYSKIKSS
jgi:hypothetical protein